MDKSEISRFCTDHCENIPAFMQMFMRTWTKLNVDTPLNHPQVGVLLYIDQKQSCKMSELATELGLSPGAITQMVDPLVSQGFLARTNDDKDRRVVLVSLTEDAQGIISLIKNRKQKIMEKMFSALSKDEAHALVSIVDKLAQALRDVGVEEIIKSADAEYNALGRAIHEDEPVLQEQEDKYSVD